MSFAAAATDIVERAQIACAVAEPVGHEGAKALGAR